MEQDKEALGQILLALAHRGGDVHQAEHHRVGVRLRAFLEIGVAQVERVDIGDRTLAAQRLLDLGVEPDQAGPLFRGLLGDGFKLEDLLLQGVYFRIPGAPKRQAPPEGVLHRAPDAETGGRAGDGIARAARLVGVDLLQAALDQVGKLEVLEEDIEELVARQHEQELVFALALVTSKLAALACGRPGARFLDPVTSAVVAVAGEHPLAPPDVSGAVESGFTDAVGRDADLLAIVDIGDAAAADRFIHRPLDVFPDPLDEPPPVAEALALRVQAPVDEIGHRPRRLLSAQPALLTRMYHSTSRRTWRSV